MINMDRMFQISLSRRTVRRIRRLMMKPRRSWVLISMHLMVMSVSLDPECLWIIRSVRCTNGRMVLACNAKNILRRRRRMGIIHLCGLGVVRLLLRTARRLVLVIIGWFNCLIRRCGNRAEARL